MPLDSFTSTYNVQTVTRDEKGKPVTATIEATLSIDLIRLVQTMAARAAARPNRRSTLGNGMIQCRIEPAARIAKK
jgi:hypothetical protein